MESLILPDEKMNQFNDLWLKYYEGDNSKKISAVVSDVPLDIIV